jgi:glycosyltransferase involved in cell wall biosynthesis
MSAKPRILMIGPLPPQLGGIEFVVDDLLKSRLMEWCQVHHIDISKPRSRGFKQFKSVTGYARSFSRPFMVSFYSFGYSLLFIFKIVWRLAFGRDQIVNLHSSAYLSFWEKCVYLDLAKLFRKKVVVHMHGSNFDRFVEESQGWTRRLLLYHLKKFDCVIALSPIWERFFLNYLPAEKIGVVENGIRTNEYVEKKYERTPFPSLVFVGEVCHRKGIYDLLKVLPDLLAAIPDLKLYIAGPGELAEVADIARKQNLQDHIELVGPQFGLDKLKYLQQAWCFSLPSYAEVFPVVIIEAMACGVPVVSTFTGGIPDAVQIEENGLLVQAGDLAALRSALQRILTDRKLREAMGERNRKRAIDCYDVDSSAAKLVRIYQRLL